MARYIDADSIRYTDLNSDMPTSNVRVWVTFKEWIDKMPTAAVASVTINEYGRLVIDVSNIKDIMHGRAFEIYFGKGMTKRMSDLISRQAAIDALKRWLKYPDYNKGEQNIIACVITMLEEAPTADVVERKKGEWFVASDGRIKCSNCLKIPINEIRIRGNIVYDMIPIKKLMKFCPNCGADMRKEV